MKVHWTDTAQKHLEAIYTYISQNSPEYAKRMVDRLTRRSQQISSHPMPCRIVPEYEINKIREVIEGPFRIIYHIKSDQTDVLAVIHGAMAIFSEKESMFKKSC